MADVVMPRLSDSMEEGTVLAWMKSVGDDVAVGDELVEIETDKANMVYESDVAGTLLEIVAEEGATLAIGEVIARVGQPTGDGARSAEGAPERGAPAGDALAQARAASGLQPPNDPRAHGLRPPSDPKAGGPRATAPAASRPRRWRGGSPASVASILRS